MSKWKRPEYSRLERGKRKLVRNSEGMPKLTEYFKVINEVKKILNENITLKKELNLALKNRFLNATTDIPNVGHFLQILHSTAQKNSKFKNKGQRYSESLKLFASYLFMIGGRKCYETLQGNLKDSLPSLSSVQRTMASSSDAIIEGEIRFSSLKAYLEADAYPLKVWVSEDATRITGRIQYDSKRDQIVGFVPALTEHGTPQKNAYPATSVDLIKKYFSERSIASNAYCFMAQPLADKAVPFCLSLFSSDNKFTYLDVTRRWDWLLKNAATEQIKICGFSSDGDTKMLKAMKIKCFQEAYVPHAWSSWFWQNLDSEDSRSNTYRDKITNPTFKRFPNFANGRIFSFQNRLKSSH